MKKHIQRVNAYRKKLVEDYYQPTPKWWRQMGDGILAVGAIVALFAPMIDNPWVSAAAGSLTIAGKFLTNLKVQKG